MGVGRDLHALCVNVAEDKEVEGLLSEHWNCLFSELGFH